MNIVLWIFQVLIAAQFMQHGLIMLFPPAEYIEIMNATLGVGLRYFIGIVELIAVLGLILPALLRIYVWLLPLTLAGLIDFNGKCHCSSFVQRRNQQRNLYGCFVIVITFVTYMRWKVKPILSRKETINSEKMV